MILNSRLLSSSDFDLNVVLFSFKYSSAFFCSARCFRCEGQTRIYLLQKRTNIKPLLYTLFFNYFLTKDFFFLTYNKYNRGVAL